LTDGLDGLATGLSIKNERSLDNMSLKNAELLYKFANGIFSNEN
ncbi:hypothetical protein RCF53_11575, partial [Staphylococcus aureus]|nr:hypothetical protein [Staphylococcus aureus]